MNIFALDQSPVKSAMYHCDKHCVKMIVETAQLLSTAHRVLDGQEIVTKKNNRKKTIWKLNDERETTIYAATHRNHPSAIWVRSTRENYLWATELLKALCSEYTHRYSRVHKTEYSGVVKQLEKVPSNIKNDKLEPFALAMPDEYKGVDKVESYRKYYVGSKSHMFKWKNREVPDWINNG